MVSEGGILATSPLVSSLFAYQTPILNSGVFFFIRTVVCLMGSLLASPCK